MTNLSFKEKSIWGSLLVLTAASGYFFTEVFAAYADGAPLTGAQLAPLVLGMITLIIVAEIALHVILAMFDKQQPADERDVLIDAKATRNAYYILVSGLVIFGGHAAAAEVLAYGRVPEAPILVVAAVFAVTIAEIGQYVSQLVYYRRGV